MSSKMKIWMDDREPKYYVELFNKLGWWVDYKRIPEEIGYDYICNDVGIERKAINDFMKSVQDPKDKHMWTQLNRMSSDDYFSYLIIDGKVYEELDQGRYTYHEYYGAKGSINTRYCNVKMDTAHNAQAFVYLLNKIFTAHQEGKHGKQRMAMKSFVVSENPMVNVLSTVRNMGTKAQKIVSGMEITKLHDICELVDRKKELIKIQDVGPGTYKNMVKEFRLDQ